MASNLASEYSDTFAGRYDDDAVSRASARSSMTQSMKRCSTYQGTGPSSPLTEEQEWSDKLRRIENVAPPASFSVIDEGDPDTEAWLERGSVVAPLSASASSVPRSKVENATPVKASSPVIGKWDQILAQCSVSPLGNGRDAYGNFISTNAQDYFVSQSPSSSPGLKSIHKSQEFAGPSSEPHLRGGGAWWKNLGVGGVRSEKSNKEEKNCQQTPNNMIAGNGKSISKESEARTASRKRPIKYPEEVPHSPTYPRTETSTRNYGRPGRYGRKWANETISGPPIKQGLPPPPPIPTKNIRRFRGSTTGSTVPISRPYARSREGDAASDYAIRSSQILSPTHLRPLSIDDLGYDLRSLQLGDSITVVGSAQRDEQLAVHRPPFQASVPARQPGTDPTPDEIEEWQENAQAEFKKRMQGIMVTYNTNISSIEEDLRNEEITQELHDVQARYFDENMKLELRDAETKTGYAILDDPIAIAEAIKTRDGYTIYHDMLQPTQPDLWTQLDDSHQKHLHVAQKPTHKPHKSSWGQGIHVVGKIARFLLAAPSDPELKTFSNRKPPMPDTLGDTSSQQGTKQSKTKIDKGKGRAVENIFGDDISTQDFARNDIPKPMHSSPAMFKPNQLHNPPLSSAPLQTIPGKQPGNGKPTPSYSLFPSPSQPQRNSIATAISGASMWPEGDTQGNWGDVRRPVMRGGNGKRKGKGKKKEGVGKDGERDGKGKKVKEEKEGMKKHPWSNVDYSAAMHRH